LSIDHANDTTHVVVLGGFVVVVVVVVGVTVFVVCKTVSRVR
jgi:hypothetical protein